MSNKWIAGVIAAGVWVVGCGASVDGSESGPEPSPQTNAGSQSSGSNGASSANPGAASKATSNSGSDRTVKPEDVEVARVTYPNGNFVAFYEPVPGFMLVGESFKYPNEPMLPSVEQKLDQKSQHYELDLYRALAPAAEMPAALMQADARRAHYAELSALRGLPATPAVTLERNVDVEGVDERSQRATLGGVAVAQQAATPDDSACPFDWFSKKYCTLCANGVLCGSPVMWSYRTGTSEFQKNDKNMVRMGMCSYRGIEHWLVKVQPWWSWSTVVDVVRATGEGWTWSKRDDSSDFDVKSKVDQADGDGYHVCGAFS